MHTCLKIGSTVLLELHIQPRAKKTKVMGTHGERLKLSIAAAPIDNEANQEVINYLATELKLSRSDIKIIRGQASRQKTISIPKEYKIIIEQWITAVLECCQK